MSNEDLDKKKIQNLPLEENTTIPFPKRGSAEEDEFVAMVIYYMAKGEDFLDENSD